MQQKKKKSKIGPLAPFAQDVLVYKPQTDRRIFEIASKLKKSDEYDVLSEQNIINEQTYPKLLKDMKSKVPSNQDDGFRQWFSDPSIAFTTQNQLMKPLQIPSYLATTKMKTLQEFESRSQANYYWTAEQVRQDLMKLFAFTYVHRVTEMGGYIYLQRLWEQVDQNMQRLGPKIQEEKQNDMKTLFEMKQEFKIETEKWPFIPQETRKYEVIEEYAPNPPEEQYCEIIWKKLKTEKQPIKCPAQCVCFIPEEFGSFSLEKQTWNSKCVNRENRIECIEHEGTTRECINQSITKGKVKQIGQDVEETICWGIDIYTRNIIYFCLPSNCDSKSKQDFISFSLLKTLNFQKEKGYDIECGCQFILENSTKKQMRGVQENTTIFQAQDRKFSKIILQALKFDPDRKAFRAHTKGVGIICKKYFYGYTDSEKGIIRNELLVQYLGEIYQPWRWFEKQDFIKKKMKDNNQKDVLPDFYNITLEMHKNDPKGLDLLFVDPINKGNYSSRLSHSCDPNCGTITTVANGKYTIGMYALKNISYGEELTFDYCSTTESKQEFKQALCLCGQERCRIHYLDLNLSKEQNNIIEREHCFLKRNACLLTACMSQPKQGLDEPLFDKYNVKESVLEDCPHWLRRWAHNILEFVQHEEQLYIQEQGSSGQQTKMEIIQFFATSFVESRVQNLIITLDKIKYYLQSCQDNSEPLQILTDKQCLEDIWGDWTGNQRSKNDESIIQELDYLFSRKIDRRTQQLDFVSIPQIQQCKDIMMKTRMLIDNDTFNNSQKMIFTRLMFLCLSHVVLQITQDTPVHFEALGLMLFFMSFTYTYFRPHEYAGFQSVKFEIHEIEYCKIGMADEKKIPKKSKKPEQRSYSSQFIWGQLVGWFKQTVANPQASLSQDRRGTLSYPSFMQSFESGAKTFPFQEPKSELSSRGYFLRHLLEKPSYMWPPETASWSYKNSYKIYGTVLFESVFSRNRLQGDFLEQVIKSAESDIRSKLNLFCLMQNRMFQRDENPFIFQHFETYIGFPIEKGSEELNLENKFDDVQPRVAVRPKKAKDKKVVEDYLGDPGAAETRAYLNQGQQQDLIIKRRKIEEYIKDPSTKEFHLSKLHIFSFDFTDYEKSGTPKAEAPEKQIETNTPEDAPKGRALRRLKQN